MRTIKFRDWDKNYNCFITDFRVEMDGGIYTFGEHHGEIQLQQTIGLLDIKNEEIYEGDILKIRDVLFGYEYIGVINYDNDSYSYLIGIIDGGETMPKCKHSISLLKKYLSFEIIGNIYENKDYLKHYAK